MWRRLVLLAAAGAALAGSAAAASSDPARSPPSGADIVVEANGPALWRVTRGRAEIVILSGIAPASPTDRWADRRVTQALRGARALLLSPQSMPGFAWSDHFRESERYRLGQPFGRTLHGELPPSTAARFSEAALSVGLKDKAFDDSRPAPAGMLLLQAAWSNLGLSSSAVVDRLKGIARAAGVRVMQIDPGGALPSMEAILSLTRPQQAACAVEALDQLDWELAHARAAYADWARGDLAGLRRDYSPSRLCAGTLPGGTARRAAAEAAWTRELLAALDRPGRTVALSDVSDLLEPSPLLAALRAHGATIAAPAGERPPSGPILATPAAMEEARAADLSAGDAPEVRIAAAPATAPATVSPPAAAAAAVLAAASSPRGAPVDLKADGRICVKEIAVGHLIPTIVCRTAAEQRDFEAAQRQQMDVFKAQRGLTR